LQLRGNVDVVDEPLTRKEGRLQRGAMRRLKMIAFLETLSDRDAVGANR